MHPALLGAIGALGWGVADFVARFAGRAVGPVNAAFAALTISFIGQSALIVLGGYDLPWVGDKMWLTAVNGIAVALAYLWLYSALSRGKISVVSPLVGTYPAVVVAFAVLMGARPSLLGWAAMAGVMLGAYVVARCAEQDAPDGETGPRGTLVVVLLSLMSSLAFAVALIAGQAATPVLGEAQTVWYSRIFSVLTIVPVLFSGRSGPIRLPLGWWPAFAAMGLLDVAALMAIYAAGHSDGGEIAAVTSSGFGAITILLAWIILKERIRPIQWTGIALIFVCVGVLTAEV